MKQSRPVGRRHGHLTGRFSAKIRTIGEAGARPEQWADCSMAALLTALFDRGEYGRLLADGDLRKTLDGQYLDAGGAAGGISSDR
jgi:hypothetical protein